MPNRVTPVDLCGIIRVVKPGFIAVVLLLSLLITPPRLRAEGSPPPAREDWLRTGIEFMLFMGYSQTRYWLKYSHYIEDWQFHFTWRDQARRWFSLEAWRFDSNPFATNWTHAVAGSLYHGIARSNGLSQKNAFLFTLAASAYWEYLVEWREIISLNDMIFTPAGGFVMGELWHRVSRGIHNRSGRFSKLTAAMLNPLLVINPPRRLGPGRPEQDWGFSGELALSEGRESRTGQSTSQARHSLVFTGRVHNDLQPIPFGQYEFHFRFDDHDLAEFTLFALTPHTLPSRGKSLFSVNTASAFTFFQRQSLAAYDSTRYQIRISPEEMLAIPRQYQDKLAAIHLLGPQLHYLASPGHWRIHHSLSLFADFALVNALALGPYSQGHDLHSLGSTTFAFGYYDALGLSALLESSIGHGPLTLYGRLALSRYWAINGLDRFDEIPALGNPDCRDGMTSLTAVLTWLPRTWPIGLHLRYEGRHRSGQLDKTRAEASMSLWTAGLTIRL